MAFFTSAVFTTTCLAPHNRPSEFQSKAQQLSTNNNPRRDKRRLVESNTRTPSNLDLCLFNHWDMTSSSKLIFELNLWSSALVSPEKGKCHTVIQKNSKERTLEKRESRSGADMVGHQECSMEEDIQDSCTPKFWRKVLYMLSYRLLPL